MKRIILSSLILSSLMISTNLSAQQDTPWYWEDEAVINANSQQVVIKKVKLAEPAQDRTVNENESSWRGDLGW